MSRTETIGEAINTVLVETGLSAPTDPFTSVDDAARQLTVLATTVGRQLVKMHQWQVLEREHVIVTASEDTGKYDLPNDFDHMSNITGWSRDQRVPLPGSVTGQTWQYLKGRNLVSSTIYMIYRNVENQFWVYPQPPDAPVPAPLTIAFEYVSRGWVIDGDTAGGTPTYLDKATKSSDVCLFDPLLYSRFLKLKFWEARGKDTVSARTEFMQVFSDCTGEDVGADTLNVANMSQPYPYMDLWRNTPNSGFGM